MEAPHKRNLRLEFVTDAILSVKEAISTAPITITVARSTSES